MESGSSPVYSPSQTADWLACPILRQFKRSSTLSVLGETSPHVWEPRSSGEWDPARLLGIAVQVGYNVWLNRHRGRWNGTESEVEQLIESAVTATITTWFVDQPRYTPQGLTKLALRGVEVLLDANLFERQSVLEIDLPLSHSRPDVISRHESQGLGVTDFKVSQRIDERYRAKRMSEYETDDQLWHYAWEVALHYGEPVKWFRVVQVILTPKAQVLVESVTVDQSRLEFWLEGAEQHWRDMRAEDTGDRPIVPRWQNCRSGRYGVCVAYDFCHLLNRDPVRAVTYYERVPK